MPEPVALPSAPDVPDEAFDTVQTIKMVAPDGKEVHVSHADAPRAFLQGGYGFTADSVVPMVAANGQVGRVPAAKAQEAFATGARIATPEEIHKADVHHEWDNFAGYLASGAAEGANQALLGAGDALAVGAARAVGGDSAADKLRGTLSDLREENPTASAIGGVAGAVAPMLASGGLGTAAEAAEGGAGAFGVVRTALGAPATALERIGSAAEHVAGAVIPEEATTLAGRIARGAVITGARTAAEGAVLGLGNELSEESLGDPELSGEKLLAALGHGALLGGAAGGLLATTGELGREVLGRVQPSLERAAGEQAFRALNPERRFVKLAEKIPGGAESVGRELLDQGVLEVGDKIDQIAPKVAVAREAAGERIGSLLDEADAAGIGGVNVMSVRQKVLEKLVPDLEVLGETNKAAVAAVQDAVGDLFRFAMRDGEDNVELTFRQAQRFRAKLDDQIKWNTNPLGPVSEKAEMLKGVRGIIEDELEAAGDKASETLGKDWAAQYKAAKLSYRRLTVADQAAENATAALTANRVVSPSDYLAGIAGFAGGGLHGGLAGIAMSAVHHVIRERGNSTAAVLIQKANALAAIQRAARSVDGQIERGIAGVLEPGKRAPVKLREAPFAKAEVPHVAHANAVVGATTGSDAHAAAIEQAAAPIAGHAPNVAKAFQSAALRTTMGLANAIPRGHLPPPSITPQFDRPITSDLEKQRFDRERAISHDPVGATFAMAAKGQLTKEDVDIFKRNSPALYQDVVQKTQEQLATLRKPLDSQREQQLRVLMGLPPADPKIAGILAQTYVTAPGQAAPNQGPGAKGPKATPKQREGIANRERLAGLNEDTE